MAPGRPRRAAASGGPGDCSEYVILQEGRMRNHKHLISTAILALIAAACFAAALVATEGAALSREDIEGSQDHPLISRMPDFHIKYYKEEEYGQADFRDEEGNRTKVEGHYFRIGYRINEGLKAPSALQVMRNYENALQSIGGEIVYEDSPYKVWMKLEKSGKLIWLYVDAWDGGGKGETYSLVIVEKTVMEQEVVADARALLMGLTAEGRAIVEGIYFDFDKAEIKPESEPALKEVAKLLTDNPGLKLYVVGHTDDLGQVSYNLKLSEARAKSVVNYLVNTHGISANRLEAHGVGPFAPVAANDTEEGRAKNRRVEIVKQAE
jgi:outer membrane protein OmpA-like peptidoglycan-associated protein